MARTDYRVFPWLKHLPGEHDQHSHGRGGPVTDEEISKMVLVVPQEIADRPRSYYEDPQGDWMQEQAKQAGHGVWALAETAMGERVYSYVSGYPDPEERLAAIQLPKSLAKAEGEPNPRFAEAVDAKTTLPHALMAQALGMSLPEYRGALASKAKELIVSALETGGVFTRTSPAGLQKILESGELRTASETGKSAAGGGRTGNALAKYLEVRDEAESQLFDYPSSGSGVVRPVYGYLSADAKGLISERTLDPGRRAIDCYGQVAIRLKPQVYERTTVTHGDSLDGTVQRAESAAVKLLQPDYRFAYPDTYPFDVSSKSPKDAKATVADLVRKGKYFLKAQSVDDSIMTGPGHGYVEAQIHRRVSAGDIDKVVFATKPSKAIKDRLAKLNIPWEVAVE